jgi:hypothetical protein
MQHLARLLVLLLAAFALTSCGDDGESSTTDVRGDADAGDVEVIDAWSTALREGEVEEAADYFALPSVAQNGPTVALQTREDVELFNRSLPCGAKLIRATSEGDSTIATFRLTERPGPGTCGDGTGALARTEFLIEDELILEWRRVPIGGPGPAPGEIT